MCRVCYGPSLSCAEFAMCRVVPKSFSPHSESQADFMVVTVTVGCLHVCKAVHSNKKCERVSSASSQRLHVASVSN